MNIDRTISLLDDALGKNYSSTMNSIDMPEQYRLIRKASDTKVVEEKMSLAPVKVSRHQEHKA